MRVLTGLQPSGKLHLGNYFASIKQMLNAQENSDMFIFIANYHAMTSTSGAKTLRQNTLEAAAAFLSLGINPDKSTFWVQSDVKEVLELYWILSQYTPMGLLERAHSYKDKTAKGISANHGLFSYPVLMAADILMYSADVVPVGKDQIQHVEIARDIALKFNNDHGDILKLPNYKVDENVATVPGVDGAKMSKSYKNTIDIFSNAKELKKQISQIVTSSEPLEAPKDWKNCNIYNIAKLFLDENGQKDLQARYERGGEGHGHFKMYLNELVWDYFADAREKFDYYMNNTNEIEKILENGAKKAKDVALPLLEKIRQTTGIY
ncbi:tryptophanyl-tRNA synthetase [Campylobacter pinnipediorum subsp. pinnipediorum]|uniref:Tryptophan--tRNA ligase n=1 Tax=Campylobacter pinnipediorum subsp. pinnipediorum TaxID=1660067 RepID=A0AAX0LCE1_9BACT|nr:tryptophan--tRNA ligase [Campylobacter pinnipediorum]AQW80469.1 tryptophanyl-tRNA synthetase [Campylobacter pinnipediorum subsp. pinnipediorum]OPA75505.1 tryptophan--tRNA ligase [Campylobacter pinnipediorum subsp. pinnipediorum]OPA82196.1 tryptophan--tRNA ligase [Campylobacter pinnipediorum subsp. pinnipediorum]